jgi:hypothetical protein
MFATLDLLDANFLVGQEITNQEDADLVLNYDFFQGYVVKNKSPCLVLFMNHHNRSLSLVKCGPTILVLKSGI